MSQSFDYWQKKAYLNFLIHKKKFLAIPLGKRVGIVTYLFIFLSYPGQNHWQTLDINPAPKPIKEITYSQDLVPFSDYVSPPNLTAQAIYVFDPESGTVLYKKDSDSPLHPASTTKIMTALVAMENYQPQNVLTVKDLKTIGNTVKLSAGEQFTVDDLVSAALISSANDAALTLAENFTQDGYLGFVDRMNQKASTLHLNSTKYSNVSGIESQDHKTTARDLTLLTKEALKNPHFLELVGTSSTTIKDVTGTHLYELKTTNELLGKVPGLKGVKTGWTESAGECLVTYTERNGLKVITVVLNSTNRFAESQALIEWAYAHHQWQEI